MADLLMMIKDSWELISKNCLTFIIFGVICFGIGYGVAWAIHSYCLSVKLHNIPEREQLQLKVCDLENEIVTLKKALRRQKVHDLIQESLRNDLSNETIGDVIVRNK